MLTGTVSEEIEVNVSAAELWNVYSTHKLTDLLLENLSAIFQKVEVLEGDGGPGTILRITFAPGNPYFPGLTYQIEKFTVVDNEKRVKVVEVMEGEVITLGFTQFRVRSEISEKNKDECIFKVSVEYEIKEDASDKISFISAVPFVAIINVVTNALNKAKEEFVYEI